MNTKMQMKMAKASQQDIDAAARLVSILGDIDKGYYPSAPDAEDADEPIFFDVDDPEHLRVFYDRVKDCLDEAPGGMFRVILGFHTIMSNDMVDPNLDYLDFHPRIVEALAQTPACAPLTPERLLDIARDTGLRSFLHGVNAGDARAILVTFQSAVDAERKTTAGAQPPVADAQSWPAAVVLGDQGVKRVAFLNGSADSLNEGDLLYAAPVVAQAEAKVDEAAAIGAEATDAGSRSAADRTSALKFEIRSTHDADESQWCQLVQDYVGDWPHETPIFMAFRQSDSLVAVSPDGEVYGLVMYERHRLPLVGNAIYIAHLYVRPSARRNSVARAFMERMLRICDLESADRLYWHTEPDNKEARPLYDQYGACEFVRYHVDFHRKRAKVSDELSGVADVLAEKDGVWVECSGCYETVDGHPVGEYHYSEILKCPLGAGCSDCGGIGAVWDNTDYEAMARALEADDAARGSAPTDVGQIELLAKAHSAIDLLLAQLVIAVPDFRPTQSPVWPDLELIAAAVRPSKAGHG